MALTIDDLKNIITPKFSSVPNMDAVVVERWINEAVYSHGYNSIDEVPDSDKSALVNLVMYIACSELAVNAGHYFRWQDGDEMVDKSMIPVQYREMAQFYLQEYMRTSNTGGYTVTWRTIGRADRP